jgi:lipopolysaccharide exporter
VKLMKISNSKFNNFIKNNLINKTSFIYNISIIMFGSLVAQFLSFASSPILTRLYTPEEFGVFSAYTSILAILAILSTLRYEHAIILPKADSDSKKLVKLNIIINFSISGITLLIAIVFGKKLSEILELQHIYIILLPVAMLLTGLFSTYRYWAIRKKFFKSIAFTTITKSIVVNVLQMIFGFLAIGTIGLIFGQTISILIGVFIIFFLIKKRRSEPSEKFKVDELYSIGREYSQFPKFSAPQGLINSLSQAIPALLLVYYFGPVVAGIYALSIKFIQLPVNLLNESFRSVFYQKSTEMVNNNQPIGKTILKVTLIFTLLSIFPIIFLWLFGPQVYSFVLGEQWYDSGIFAQWLSLAVFGSMIATPTVVAINVYKIQKIHMVHETVVLALKLGGFIVAGLFYKPLTAIIIFSIISTVMNLFLIIYTNIKLKKINLEGGIEGAKN